MLCSNRLVLSSILAAGLTLVSARLSAQIPELPPGQQLPTVDQARQALTNPALVEQLRKKLQESGLTPDQVRSRLRAAGYPDNMLDEYLSGADTTKQVRPSPHTLDAVRSLGVLSEAETDSLRIQDSTSALSDSLQQIMDSLKYVRSDSARADS